MRRALLGLLLVPSLAWADTVYLKNGRTLSGVIVERTKDRLVLEIGPGRVGVPLAQVERIVASSSPLAQYQQRAAQLDAGDVSGWLELASWADDHDLRTRAREAYQHVTQIDPDNAAAQRGLGRALQGGEWLTFEEGQRARGLVEHDGAWVTPAERVQLIAVAADAQAMRAAQAAADARAREAEARAQEAEARAREAEANAAQSYGGGIAYWPPLAGACLGGACGPDCGRSCADAPPAPPAAPQPRPQPRPHRNPSSAQADTRDRTAEPPPAEVRREPRPAPGLPTKPRH